MVALSEYGSICEEVFGLHGGWDGCDFSSLCGWWLYLFTLSNDPLACRSA